MRLTWLIAALFLSATLAVLEWWMIENHIFWQYVWSDVPMHLLGGLTLGVLSVGLLRVRRKHRYVVGLALAFIAWEIFEYVFGVPREANYAFDTCIDLLMDTLGGTIAYYIARISIWKR